MAHTISIPFAQPEVGTDEIQAIQKVIESKWLTTGKEALAFEKEFSEFLSVDNLTALAVQSCTAGLHLAYKALNTNHNSTIISSPLTFIASISPALHCGAKVQFIDCAPNSMYPSAESLDSLPIHTSHHTLTTVPLAGYHPHYESLLALARDRNLYILEDVAHAFPAYTHYHNTRMPYGSLGDIGVFSFYANKTITTGEGGMIVSKNPEFIDTMSLLRNHGMNKITWERFNNAPAQFDYDILEPGYKYNLPDILASIGRVQLQKAKEFHQKRTQIAKKYLQALADRDYLILPSTPDAISLHAWHLFVLQITHPRLSRTEFMHKLAEKGIGTSVHYTPLHLMHYFKTEYGLKPEDFPNAYNMFQNILSIPIYPTLDDDSVNFICRTIIDIGDNN